MTIAIVLWCLLALGVGVLMALFASWFLARKTDFLEDHFRGWW